MANFNITEKQFNGNDYDTLYPKNTSQQSLLNDNTLATKLGLSGDGVTVNQAIDAITTILSGKANIVYGTYVGNGESTKSLSFNGTVMLLWVNQGQQLTTGSTGTASGFLVMYNCPSATFWEGASVSTTLTWSNNNKTVSWDNSALNTNNLNYYYLAITKDSL